MTAKNDKDFHRQRNETFDNVIAFIDEHIKTVTPVVILHSQEMSPDNLRSNALIETWPLFSNGIRHLKNGAPGNQPGSMTEALSRTSLRASPFAAALGIKPPQFEPMYFSVDYTTGREAALFLCRCLIRAAEGDLPKSRLILQQKILAEKPTIETLKEQMALSFNMRVEIYTQVCQSMKSTLAEF